MPNEDRIEPVGTGPKAGRGMGGCAGSGMPGRQAGQGRGFHRGYRCKGRARGFARRNNGICTESQGEVGMLREEMEALRMQLAAFCRQLNSSVNER